ncbi:MAG TPA: hypothetical protein VKI40_05260, partial [Terriglobales bacterium]|nr:hypothetical protein [Terriglobales bacterium]
EAHGFYRQRGDHTLKITLHHSIAEAPTFRPGLRMPSRCKGANQNNAPGTPKNVARRKPKNAALSNQATANFKSGH